MDLSLWDPPDDHGYPTLSSSNQSRYDTEDHWNYYFSLGYGRDMIEEDVLNEKSCVQVLRKLIDKADEEIIKLEEDIVMLQCQLAWVDEDWSKQCSGALGKEIGDLDILVQIRKEITDAHFNVQVEPRRKRSYIVKETVISKAKDTQHRFENEGKVANSYLESRETEIKISETVQSIYQPADVILASQLDHVKQLTEDSSKTRKSKAYTHAINKNPVSQKPSVGIIIRETNKVHERTEAMEAPATDKCDVEGVPVNSSLPMKDVHRLTLNDLHIIARKRKMRRYSNLRKKELQKLLGLEPRDSCSLVPLPPLQPFNPMVEMRKRRDTVKEVVISKAKDPQHRFENEGKVANSYPESRETETKISETVQPADVILSSQSDHVKQLTEDSSKTRKPNAYTHAINKKLVSQKPSVGIIIRETKKLHERTEAMEAPATDKCDMEGVPVNSLPPMKDVHSLTVDDLHIMARERKLRGYSKLRKKELQKLLGLEPQDSVMIHFSAPQID
ncbi:hypothetical protein BUALT_Bualt12G0021400 [Buddleja alternifolia]|uniref:Rho termination factor N-terminal domain-containing protein n=1 Tax=Buddleja alternifolia TaxID=168488 RepID=A0AAV6WWF6_9LAMI|nr:hypothetical protein BUALT_Bualt12G0021400 [Buddleja alternifolia]